ncbi:uncharacterized protein LOC122196859 isoform X3 [Lactuca sativa]|uniref:uncharacterized protein LOC122196859 isoform X3 n=1 Tax=Lactuca sativa TaxID=4236 RepID=UPI0022B02DDB|nr:uncharacterized protein LOC122196859 isoform X3 [Lactuca sativa]
MEDIEDLLVGGGAAPPGFRIPITAVVGINPIKKKKNNKLEPSSLLQNSSTHQVPGTQMIQWMILVRFQFYWNGITNSNSVGME